MQSYQTARSGRRRGLATVGVAAAIVAGLVVTPPAYAAEATVDDATFVWGLNGYSQVGIFGPWSYSAIGGNAEQLVGSVSGGSQTEYLVDPVPATSMPPSSPQKTPNAIKFSAGTGTVDPDTGAASLAWEGTYTINAYPPQFGAPNEIYRDPQLTVDANGSGSLTVDFSVGAGVDMEGNPTPEVELGRLTLFTFSAGSLSNQSESGYRITPDYQGIEVDVPGGSTQVRSCAGGTGWWGSWSPEFVTAVPTSIAPHFYSTGCGGLQDYKPPLPIDVSFTVEGTDPDPDPEPSDNEQSIQVVIPEITVLPGEFSWAIDGSNDLVDLGTAVQSGDHFAASGAINPIRVTDTRAESPAWSVSAQVSDFTSNDETFSGKYLGWTPEVTENTGGAVAGDPVASGFDSGDGLSVSSTLGSAADGHELGSALLGAGLSLKVPVSVGDGTYQATLTLTALS